MNTMLTAPVLVEEVRATTFSIKEDSAPGADGLTGTFYKRFWSIVGLNTVREVQSFFQDNGFTCWVEPYSDLLTAQSY